MYLPDTAGRRRTGDHRQFSREATYGTDPRTLIEDLVSWTLTQHAGADRRERIDLYEWTTFFGDLLAMACARFDDATYDAIIGRYLDEAWRREDADLVPRYVRAFLNRRLSLIDEIDARDVTRWHDLVSTLLGTENTRAFRENYRRQYVSETLASFVFVSTWTGDNYFTDRWPHAHRFESAITAWVAALAHVRRAYRWLLIFLHRFFLVLHLTSPPPAVRRAGGLESLTRQTSRRPSAGRCGTPAVRRIPRR